MDGDRLINGSNAVGNKPANQMTHVSLNTDSDSSSSDQIQLQMRRNLTKHRRKRRSRSSDSYGRIRSSRKGVFNCSHYCLKLFLIGSISLIAAILVFYMAKLHSKVDQLQAALNDISTKGGRVPQDLFQLHSQVNSLENNSAGIYLNLTRSFHVLNNLTSEVAILKAVVEKLNDAVEVQSLQQVLKDLNKRVSSCERDLSEFKLIDRSMSQKIQSLDDELAIVHSNISQVKIDCDKSIAAMSASNNASLLTSLSNLPPVDHNNNATLAIYKIAMRDFETHLSATNATISHLSESVSHLTNLFSSLQNWKVQADAKLNQTMALTHHLQELVRSDHYNFVLRTPTDHDTSPLQVAKSEGDVQVINDNQNNGQLSNNGSQNEAINS